MNLNQKISKNFVLKEMCGGRVDNVPKMDHLINAFNLTHNVLQVLRDKYGSIIVTSFYRNSAYNKSIGGVATSQHTKGEAADLQFKESDVEEVFNDIVKNNIVKYDQVILEDRNGVKWLHISSKMEDNRKQALMATYDSKLKKMIYKEV